MFLNRGDGTFAEAAASLGLADTELGTGVVCADFDNDGDVDILQLHDALTLWRNDTVNRNHLRVRLVGRAPNTEAAGARITVTSNGVTQMREVSIGSKFLSQDPTLQVFGLAGAEAADVSVQWPDGTETVRADVAHGTLLVLTHPQR